MPTNKNAEFLAGEIAFMKKYSVTPANDIDLNIGDKAVTMKNAKDFNDYTFSTMQGTSRVAWLNLEKRKKAEGSNIGFIPQAEGSVSVGGSFLHTPGAIESYFLPWSNGGAIINLTIPKKGSMYRYNNIRHFFTATISGCSIFFKGNAESPQIFHAGGDTGQKEATNAAKFWRDLMVEYDPNNQAILAEVNKTNYVSDPKSKTKGLQPGTRNSDKFLKWLKKDQNKKDLDISQVFPWGCVMGLRDDTSGTWTFYLQENATIFYAKITRAKFLSFKKDTVGQVRMASRPLQLTQIFPAGTAQVKFHPQMLRGLE